MSRVRARVWSRDRRKARARVMLVAAVFADE